MTTRWLRGFLGCSFLASTLAHEARAAAQGVDPPAALFDRGLAAMEKGRYAAGCPDLAESQRLDPRPGTLFTLASCEDRWGHTATAVAEYSEYLQVYEQLPEDRKAAQGERPKVARAQRDKLIPAVPELTLMLSPGAPAGVVVKRDGRVVTAAALGAAWQVDPGEHTVSTEVPGGGIWRQQILVGKGEKKKVALEVRDGGPVARQPLNADNPAPSPILDAGPSTRRVATYVVGGAGLAGLVLGGVMGGLTLGKKGTVTQHCGKGIQSSDETACDQTGLDAVNSGKTFGLVSTVGLAVGLAGVGAAVILYLAEPTPPKPTAGSRGRWLSVGLLSAGPAGATVSAQGAW
ncbi:MAG: hypothetical protein ABJE95_10450 [Byssovorax sp.]